MKTADISMDYNSMSNLVKETMDIKNDFETMQKKMKNLADNLGDMWQGNAKKEFEVAYSKINPKLSSISNMLATFADAVNQSASDEQNLELHSATVKQNLTF